MKVLPTFVLRTMAPVFGRLYSFADFVSVKVPGRFTDFLALKASTPYYALCFEWEQRIWRSQPAVTEIIFAERAYRQEMAAWEASYRNSEGVRLGEF